MFNFNLFIHFSLPHFLPYNFLHNVSILKCHLPCTEISMENIVFFLVLCLKTSRESIYLNHLRLVTRLLLLTINILGMLIWPGQLRCPSAIKQTKNWFWCGYFLFWSVTTYQNHVIYESSHCLGETLGEMTVLPKPHLLPSHKEGCP